ncbi:molecular chaperone DnaJ [Mesoterricola sediminis]|uniref:Chaperone protein DnaJ n=1 Tax=Mesoterricola sediminis TaxID=2927980 RepID=A0AA48KCE0_9BACT|nr:molecular chaperone DnaJ [Mesoterricola sediminis]BDU75965.1 chaperone protein DnaJ [Mesoterricola sediminis]
MKRDYYEVLGVGKEATLDEIKKAYRRLAMQFHPDQNPGNKEAEEKFKEAAEAYAILSDADKRRRYDQFGFQGAQGSGGGTQFQFDPSQFAGFEDILGSFFGGGIFADLFGGGGARRRSGGGERGSDLQYNLRISFKEALFGVDSKEIDIPRQDACDTCRGSGCAPGTSPQVCPNCHGNGQVAVRQGFLQMAVTCPRCEGRGQIIPSPCSSCRGAGRISRRTKVKFRIPAGVDRGQRLRLQNEGEAGIMGGPPGDLFIAFDVEDDPDYERDGLDLHRRLEVPWALLVLGGDFPVETPYGKESVRIAKGTPSDKVVKIPNAGVPRLRAAGRGDLYLHLRVAVPTRLSSQEEALVRQLLEGAAVSEEGGEEEGFLAKVFGSDKGKKKKKKR